MFAERSNDILHDSYTHISTINVTFVQAINDWLM